MNATFATCLSEADGRIEGTTVLNAAIAPTGEVTSVATVAPGGVSPKAAACFREVLAHAKFAPVAEAAVVQVRLVPHDLRAILTSQTSVARN
jgi:hypothetical protein